MHQEGTPRPHLTPNPRSWSEGRGRGRGRGRTRSSSARATATWTTTKTTTTTLRRSLGGKRRAWKGVSFWSRGASTTDATVFLSTQLPVLCHDSILFKNIENDSVAALLQVYLRSEKQSFVAIDEIQKYGAEAAGILRERSAIQLDNAHVLYIKDWRK